MTHGEFFIPFDRGTDIPVVEWSMMLDRDLDGEEWIARGQLRTKDRLSQGLVPLRLKRGKRIISFQAHLGKPHRDRGDYRNDFVSAGPISVT